MSKKKSIPIGLPIGLDGLMDDSMSNMTRSIQQNIEREVKGIKKEKEKDKTETQQPEQQPQTAPQRAEVGRPRKLSEDFVKVEGNDDWALLTEYVNQYKTKVYPKRNYLIDNELVSFFETVRSLDKFKDGCSVGHIVNSVLRMFVNKHKEEVKRMILESL